MFIIELNKELDCETYESFRDFSIGGTNFGRFISADHPGISKDNCRQYIDQYYERAEGDLASASKTLGEALGEKEEAFVSLLQKYFLEDFSGSSYTGYLSMFNCNPRYPEKNSFQVFFKKSLQSKIATCFHEAMHFALFDYCDRHFSRQTGNLDKNSGEYWELSEIFNFLILNEPAFVNLAGAEEKLFYPALAGKMMAVKNIWDSSNADVRQFLDGYFGKYARLPADRR